MKEQRVFRPGAKEKCEQIKEACRGKNTLVHAIFPYYCMRCCRSEFIYLGYGVEGPKELGDNMIASPFCIMCPCGGEMMHSGPDRRFKEPIPVPFNVRYFRVPNSGPKLEYFCTSAFSGELVESQRMIGIPIPGEEELLKAVKEEREFLKALYGKQSEGK